MRLNWLMITSICSFHRIFLPESRACESASDVFQITLKKEEMEQCFRDVDNEEFPPDFSVGFVLLLPFSSNESTG